MTQSSTQKTNIWQIISTVLLTFITLGIGLMIDSNNRINNKLDSVIIETKSNTQEITYIKTNYETKLDNRTLHQELINKYHSK